jgi:hypothetical protein
MKKPSRSNSWSCAKKTLSASISTLFSAPIVVLSLSIV